MVEPRWRCPCGLGFAMTSVPDDNGKKISATEASRSPAGGKAPGRRRRSP